MTTVNSNIVKLMKRAKDIRQHIVRSIAKAGGGHAGPALSCTDILVVLYFHTLRVRHNEPKWPDRDRFIMSKGHGCVALYSALAEAGFFDVSILDTLCRHGSILGGHQDMHKVPGVEASTGSLGHGLPIGVGTALAARLDKKDYRTFVLMGDGECDEGSVWEAAMAAKHYALNNLIAIVDKNRLQCDGWCKDIMNTDPFAAKWQSFGWHAQEVNGHDMNEIITALDNAIAHKNQPSVVIAHTTKGKGVSFMENQPKWHYGPIREEEAKKALSELQDL